jgi:hypothetical protein
MCSEARTQRQVPNSGCGLDAVAEAKRGDVARSIGVCVTANGAIAQTGELMRPND